MIIVDHRLEDYLEKDQSGHQVVGQTSKYQRQKADFVKSAYRHGLKPRVVGYPINWDFSKDVPLSGDVQVQGDEQAAVDFLKDVASQGIIGVRAFFPMGLAGNEQRARVRAALGPAADQVLLSGWYV